MREKIEELLKYTNVSAEEIDAVLATIGEGQTDSFQQRVLPEPAQKQQFYCNKCGSHGEGDGVIHMRANGSGMCDYMAPSTGPFFTAEQMHTYASDSTAALLSDLEELERKQSVLVGALERLSLYVAHNGDDWVQKEARTALAAVKKGGK